MSVTFYYPSTSPYTYELELPNPILGDSYRIITASQIYQDMNGDNHSHIKPVTYNLLLTFQVLTNVEAAAFEQFYKTAIGNQIKYLDHDFNIWLGYFTNDSYSDVTNRSCDHDVTIEFAGSKV